MGNVLLTNGAELKHMWVGQVLDALVYCPR